MDTKKIFIIESLETFKMIRAVEAETFEQAKELHNKLLDSSVSFDDFHQDFLGTQIASVSNGLSREKFLKRFKKLSDQAYSTWTPEMIIDTFVGTQRLLDNSVDNPDNKKMNWGNEPPSKVDLDDEIGEDYYESPQWKWNETPTEETDSMADQLTEFELNAPVVKEDDDQWKTEDEFKELEEAIENLKREDEDIITDLEFLRDDMVKLNQNINAIKVELEEIKKFTPRRVVPSELAGRGKM